MNHKKNEESLITLTMLLSEFEEDHLEKNQEKIPSPLFTKWMSEIGKESGKENIQTNIDKQALITITDLLWF